MELNEYQEKAMGTCMPSSRNVPYMLLNLQAEVGELSGKLAKAIRKELLFFGTVTDEGEIYEHNHLFINFEKAKDADLEELKLMRYEIGDVLWQLSGLCSVLGYELEDIAKENLEKLASRKRRGVIDGSGDER